MNCRTCDRPMRPQHASLEQHPGTVKTGTAGECSTCTDRKAVREPAPLRLCNRCGYPTRKDLCADCYDTLPRAERKLWASKAHIGTTN